ncbi:MAG: 50S ribosomal protein L3 [Clostridia bacterium]|jgi:large subunit ribosomal protein L3|nr:50S ribosomal protein L3 [Clostridia bacterium]
MVNEIYGTKIGMTQIFDENGVAIPVTAIEAKPLTVVAKKTADKDGYNAIVVSFGDVKEKNVNKPRKGLFAKAGVEVQRHLREIKVENVDEYEIGSKITVEALNDIKAVDVQATSKGKGFQGVIKRHGQHRGPMGHGSMYHRRPGSMGSTTTPGRVFKGKKLPGHMGSKTSTVLNLEVVKVDTDKNVVLVKGSVPGAKKAVVRVRKSVK